MLYRLSKVLRYFQPKPEMLDVCQCWHTFEEHDWGAYRNLSTDYSAACLCDCLCDDFTRSK